MKFSKFARRASLAVALSLVGAGIVASPAMAEGSTPSLEDSNAIVGTTTFSAEDLPTPDGVSDATWDATLSAKEAKYGDGDKAYLEALKALSPMSVSAYYCSSYENITRPGAWYKIPRDGGTLDCVLETGNNSVAVTVLQQTLNKCYGRGLVEDGAFGNGTYNALMYAQSVEGIGVDGVYGPITRSNLKWWGGGSICTHGYSLGI